MSDSVSKPGFPLNIIVKQVACAALMGAEKKRGEAVTSPTKPEEDHPSCTSPGGTLGCGRKGKPAKAARKRLGIDGWGLQAPCKYFLT